MSRFPALVAFAVPLVVAARRIDAQGTRVSAASSLSGEVRQVGAERPVIDAARLTTRIKLDGRLDEPAWASAPAAVGFRQRFPAEGAAAPRATRVRLLADDEALYVGARLDDAPDSISAPLGRRDAHPPSDEFLVYLDARRDGRTALVFAVTPSGVRSDARVVDDADPDATWDGVWDAAVARDSAGWSAELRIPLAQLSFAAPRPGEPLTLGVELERVRSRRGEVSQWALVPQTTPVPAARFGTLRLPPLGGLRGRMQVTPYALARGAGGVGGTHDGATAGADVRLALSSSLALTAAVNPDFGQVEADSTAVNLSALELFLPERRPFFVAGSDLFRLRLNQWYDETSELFYTRRIGRRPTLDAPDGARDVDRPETSTILAAAKLAGRTASGWSLGVLDARTAAARAAWLDAAGARRTSLAEPAANTAVARLTRELRGGRTVLGAIGTAVTRDLDSSAALTMRRSALTGGVDLLHRAGKYEAQAMLVASRVGGTREAITATQLDGVHFFQRPGAPHLGVDSTRTTLGGWASSARVAKVGGSFHWELAHRAYSPGYEPNDAGFLAQADRTLLFGHVDYVRPVRDGARLRRWFVGVNRWDYRDFGGARTALGANVVGMAELPSLWRGVFSVGELASGERTDLLRGGPALRRSPHRFVDADVTSDPRRALSFGVTLGHQDEPQTGFRSEQWSTRLTVRPSGRLELTAAPALSTLRDPEQYVATAHAPNSTRWVLGDLRQRTASVTARAVLAFTPSLTLQGYAQPFVSVGRFERLGEVGDPSSRRVTERVVPLADGEVRVDDDPARLVVHGGDPARRYTIARPDFATRSLNGNAVLRWDYAPGSALFVVWSHTRAADEPPDSAATTGLRDAARSLWSMPGRNEIIVKFSRSLVW
jgi:hypothetical protein